MVRVEFEEPEAQLRDRQVIADVGESERFDLAQGGGPTESPVDQFTRFGLVCGDLADNRRAVSRPRRTQV